MEIIHLCNIFGFPLSFQFMHWDFLLLLIPSFKSWFCYLTDLKNIVPLSKARQKSNAVPFSKMQIKILSLKKFWFIVFLFWCKRKSRKENLGENENFEKGWEMRNNKSIICLRGVISRGTLCTYNWSSHFCFAFCSLSHTRISSHTYGHTN